MNTPFSPAANRHNPQAAYAKIYEWVLRFGSATVLSSSCENPIVMNFELNDAELLLGQLSIVLARRLKAVQHRSSQ